MTSLEAKRDFLSWHWGTHQKTLNSITASLPKEIEFLSEIPKTTSGKVDYKTLQNRDAETRGGEQVSEGK